MFGRVLSPRLLCIVLDRKEDNKSEDVVIKTETAQKRPFYDHHPERWEINNDNKNSSKNEQQNINQKHKRHCDVITEQIKTERSQNSPFPTEFEYSSRNTSSHHSKPTDGHIIAQLGFSNEHIRPYHYPMNVPPVAFQYKANGPSFI